MATGIYANDSKITFEVQGAGGEQWVSFYHQSRFPPFPFARIISWWSWCRPDYSSC